MCMIEIADPCDVCRVSEPVARKCYWCSECGMAIHPGEKYQRAHTIMDGLSQTFKMCSSCMDCKDWLMRECNGYCFGGVAEDLTSHWYDEGIRTMELGRLVVMIKRRHGMSEFMRRGLVR